MILVGSVGTVYTKNGIGVDGWTIEVRSGEVARSAG